MTYSEQSVGSKSEVQTHWAEQKPINDQLRGVVEPLAFQFSEEIGKMLVEASPDTRHEMLQAAGNTYELPYGRVGMLPPALFGTITSEEVLLDGPLAVPQSDDGISKLAKNYLKWAKRVVKRGEFKQGAYPSEETLVNIMGRLKGVEYPKDAWYVAAEARRQALSEETLFAIDAHCTNRIFNAALDYDQLNDATKATHDSYENYILVMSQVPGGDEIVSGTRDYVQLPIGEYGRDAADKLARLTVSLSDFIKTSPVIDEGAHGRIDDSAHLLLAKHTARTRERVENGIKDASIRGVKETLTEGVLSISQVISLLTSERVDGYDDHDELVAKILDSDIIEQFTRLTAPGYIGPITLAGLHLRNPLVMKEGKPTLSGATIEILNGMRKQHVENMMTAWTLYKDGKGAKPNMLGVTCPAAAPKGGITACKSAFKSFYSPDMSTAEKS